MSGVGNFFAIGKTEWDRVISLGMGAASAYLVLARYSARDNRTTTASVHAVESRTSISRGRAQQALTLLEGHRLIRRLSTKEQRPRYDLTPLDRRSDRPMIWLPNELVDGVNDIDSPLEQVRQTQNVGALRLYIDLYGSQDLPEHGGVPRNIIWQTLERTRLSTCGNYVVWGWSAEKSWVRWSSPTTLVHQRKLTLEEQAAKVSPGTDFFQRLDLLLTMGLVQWVPHVYESDAPDAEPVLALRWGSGDSMEERLARAAYDASHRLLEPNAGAATRADHSDITLLVPLPLQLEKVHLVGVLRLRHRPKDQRSSAWWANYSTNAERWLARFAALAPGTTRYAQPRSA